MTSLPESGYLASVSEQGTQRPKRAAPFKRGGPNYAFVLAAQHVAASKALRRVIVAKIKELAGDKAAERRSLYNSLVPFIRDFGNENNGSGVTANDEIEYIYSEVSDNRIAWPIPSLLAWISYYHSPAAEELFTTTGLTKNHGIRYQAFVGLPGEWADAQLKKPKRESTKSPPAPNPALEKPLRKLVKAPKEARLLRSDTFSDAKRISKNPLHIKELINALISVAEASGVTIKELTEEIDSSMADHRLRNTKPQSRMSRLPQTNRRTVPGRSARSRRIDMQNPEFISKAIGWLSAKHPSALVAYYETKGLKLVDKHPEVFVTRG